ncbi:MAG: L-serine ammonia-lyase, iron-sulfur-dependent subunit beta [Firmicutes bacterium]|nr:L-serine ammonia-lyase, iron-sulfur-dependent subunit beta [Bacillota bacterium]
MRDISVFDVIGPNMIGPSSSHTAGALRIARMTEKMAEDRIVKVKFTLYGSFARTYHGHGTDRALVGGILGYEPEDRRIRDSLRLAKEAGLEFSFETNTTETDVHPNTVRIQTEDASGNHLDVVGESIGGGNARLREINGVEVDISGDLKTLIIRNHDEPGVIAHITECLSHAGINIAFMNVYRKNKYDEAVIVIEVDGDIPRGLVEQVRKIPAVVGVTMISL